MNWKFTFRNIGIASLLILITACSNNATNTPTMESTQTQEPAITETSSASETPVSPTSSMPAAGTGLCANAYYPVREGATWTYQSSGGPVGGYGFTDTITSVREDGFTLTSQFDKLTRTQEWACRPEGLAALQLGGTSAATLNSDEMQVSLDVSNVSGITFAASIMPGDQWSHALEFTGSLTVAGQEIDATGNAQSNFSAVGVESITVPAGTFDTLKIRVDTIINISGIFNGVSFPVTVTSPYDYWFVQGVGWVKASGTGSVGGESFTETIELQSYNIP
ncbi:MAG TPA: hypothetical protein VJ785_19080 [Anaerolineales bacterium]|nr:hypothetical protein [Anaerolineales bacterium]